MGGSRALALGWPLVAGQLAAGVLGPLTASFAAGSTTPIPVTGLGPGETVASVTGSFTVSGNSIVPSAGLLAGSYSPVVTTSTGRTLTIAVTANVANTLTLLDSSPLTLLDGSPLYLLAA